jgi:hypothetical protein
MTSFMETLVNCPCGHTLSTHDGGGCSGERLRPCSCKRDRSGALEAAVTAVRTQPMPAPDAMPPTAALGMLSLEHP